MAKLLKHLSKRDWLCLLLAVLFIVGQVWLDLEMPDYMSEITRLTQTEGSQMRQILIAGGKMLLCAFGSLVAAAATSILSGRIATDFGANLRSAMFHKVQSFSSGEIGRFSTPSLITRTTNDITHVQLLIIMGLQSIIKAPLMAAWAITKISGKSREWTFSTAAAIVMLFIIVIFAVVLVLPKFKKLQRLTDDLNRVTRENLSGIRVVRAYNAEEYQEEKFRKANEALTAAHLFTGRTMAFLMPLIMLVLSGLSLAIYWIGADLINNAALPQKITLFADMIVFSQYAMQVVMAFMLLVILFVLYPRASVSAKRILEVLNTEESIRDGSTSIGDQLKGEVEFKNVTFAYPDANEPVLRNVSFTAHKGETVAFIGATGSGKSTLINLIPRFYDATEGEVLVDGVDVKTCTQAELRRRIGYISQQAVLFSGTIKSNVAFGRDENTDIAAALRTAQAEEFVSRLPEGENAPVAQGGTNYSGGQKQRLSIARALSLKPEILIFDDSFSALDYKTDSILRKALAEEAAESTKLIVAQRIGTIRDADRIVVLDDGEVAGIGTHSELMQSCEVYRQIAYSQLSEEELA